MEESELKKDSLPSAPAISRGLIAAFVVFLIVGCFMAMPCLCMEGAVKGRYKTIFYLIFLARFLYGLFRKRLSWADFFFWACMFMLFYFMVESL